MDTPAPVTAPCAWLNCSIGMTLTTFRLELLLIMVINFCKKERLLLLLPH